jgi:hypothetical protein
MADVYKFRWPEKREILNVFVFGKNTTDATK